MVSQTQPRSTGKNQLVYVYTAYYRKTSMGGRDETWVFKVENNELVRIQPILSERSRSGNHGWDTWYLEPGMYIVIEISRSNNRKKPYTVVVQELYVSANPQAVNRAVWRGLFVEEIMSLDEIDYLIEKAKEVVVNELT